MHTTVRLARDRRADSVHYTDTEGAPLKAVPQREDGISRLTRLREEHADVVTEDGRLAVQEVARELDTHGDLGELLEDRARSDARVVARPARNEHDAAAAADDGEVRAQAAQGDFVGVEVDAPTHSVND
jgi:hypothetical protein